MMNRLERLLIASVAVSLVSCAGVFDPNHNPVTSWEHSFDCGTLEECVSKTYVPGPYTTAFPVGEAWTYGTLQPDGATLELTEAGENTFLRGSVPPATGGTTSKAQVCRKFPPAGIDAEYTGMSAFFAGDVVTITMRIRINGAYATTGNVYFLDIEDSTTASAGIRFFMNGTSAIGVNRDKIMEENPVIYSLTTIPTDTWFDFRTEFAISESSGYYRIWIDGDKALDEPGLSFVPQLKFYDSVMVGITGTLLETHYELDVDDVRVEVDRAH